MKSSYLPARDCNVSSALTPRLGDSGGILHTATTNASSSSFSTCLILTHRMSSTSHSRISIVYLSNTSSLMSSLTPPDYIANINLPTNNYKKLCVLFTSWYAVLSLLLTRTHEINAHFHNHMHVAHFHKLHSFCVARFCHDRIFL